MDKVSKLEGVKIMFEFLSQTLSRIPKCNQEQSEPLDGLMVYERIIPSEDILFKQKPTTSKMIYADVILGFHPVSKIIRVAIDSPLFISP